MKRGCSKWKTTKKIEATKRPKRPGQRVRDAEDTRERERERESEGGWDIRVEEQRDRR